ncbi:unnamed protein product [Arctia plantaginis]|uniref:Uncharacterized protein n=1 Tax=Arctia plantaginis TaxID=874455 RepID=A0A8S0ZY65_ARCPL|nr:unnamed protein product [Arctia plantaginis]
MANYVFNTGLRMRTAATVLCSSLLFTLLRRRRLPRHSIQSSSKHPVTGQLRLTVFNSDAVLAVGQPPVPIAAFDEAVIAVGQCGKS